MSVAALTAVALTFFVAAPAAAAPSVSMAAAQQGKAQLNMKIYTVFVTAPGESTSWAEVEVAEQFKVANSYWESMSNGRISMELQPALSLESSIDLRQDDRKLVAESLNRQLGVNPICCALIASATEKLEEYLSMERFDS